MRYSLLSRFQGTLLAAVVAQALESTWDDLAASPRLDWASPGVSCFDLNASTPQSLTRIYAENLIQHGDLNLEDLCRRGSDAVPSALLPVQAIVGLLPVILFFHEDEAKLKQKVIQATSFWHSPLELQNSALAVAYAIAQALREHLQPSTLVSQTIAYLPEASLVQLLQQVQRLLEQGAGLDSARTQLLRVTTARPIEVSVALAFYCFLSTLENFQLTVTRSLRAAYESQLTTIVAAVLSGAYNSSIGIPLVWRLALSQELPSDTNWKPSAGRFPQVEQLLAAWAGSYAPTKAWRSSSTLVPVAAPGVIRPR